MYMTKIGYDLSMLWFKLAVDTKRSVFWDILASLNFFEVTMVYVNFLLLIIMNNFQYVQTSVAFTSLVIAAVPTLYVSCLMSDIMF